MSPDPSEPLSPELESRFLELYAKIDEAHAGRLEAEKRQEELEQHHQDLVREFTRLSTFRVSGIVTWLLHTERDNPSRIETLLKPFDWLRRLRGKDKVWARLDAEAQECLNTGLFDPVWYMMENQDLVSGLVSPVHHWVEIGWREERDPGPFFSVSAYLASHPELKETGENPLLHFARTKGVTDPETSTEPSGSSQESSS